MGPPRLTAARVGAPLVTLGDSLVRVSPWLQFGKINTDNIVDMGKLVVVANGVVGLAVLTTGVLVI
jgi:hypothetical protein